MIHTSYEQLRIDLDRARIATNLAALCLGDIKIGPFVIDEETEDIGFTYTLNDIGEASFFTTDIRTPEALSQENLIARAVRAHRLQRHLDVDRTVLGIDSRQHSSWAHSKSGGIYVVRDLSVDTARQISGAVYHPSGYEDILFFRPLDDGFLGFVQTKDEEVGDVYTLPRFIPR